MATGTLNPTPAQPSRPADLRQSNCRTLLRLLQDRTVCSRAELVRLSGLSAPTVTAAIQSLEKIGLVEARGEGQSSGGRPPELLRFNSSHGFVVAADIGGTHLRMMLADLKSNVLAHWTGRLSAWDKTPSAVCGLIAQGLQELCRQAAVPYHRVLHMTVGAPGITDVGRGVVISAPNLTGWINVSLQQMLVDSTGISTLIENDTNLAAVGEHSSGAAASAGDFIFIAMGTGVGAGVFLGGRLHHGAAWSAGEIGYLGVPGEPREPLALERTGQLERVIGGEGIERQWLAQLARSNRHDPALKALRGAQIFDLAQQHDPDAISVLQSTATVLADAIATITLLFNPSLVVLGGGVGSHECLRAATERVLASSDFPHPAVRISALGPQAQLHGAIATSLAAIESRLLC